MKLPLQLASVLLKIFMRDRQAIFFIVFFPVIFMMVLGYSSTYRPVTIQLGLIEAGSHPINKKIIAALEEDESIVVHVEEAAELHEKLAKKQIAIILYLPEKWNSIDTTSKLKVQVDSSQLDDVYLSIDALNKKLLTIERQLRNTEPLFNLEVEDIQPRPLRYIDFLLPGILAFTIMQIAIAGSGFNLVEYRRKGILKRLFVTPVQPSHFIVGVVIARLILCLMQISILLAIATLLMKVQIIGNIAELYAVAILATTIFLCIGFALGSIAKTQQAIQSIGNLVIFPQIFLSGVFYPIDSLPGFLQAIATILPLSFVATALREISTNGLSVVDLALPMVGMLTWLVIGYVLATRLFIWKDVAG